MGGRDELTALLGRAGLDVVGDWSIEEVLPPPFAWRRVAAWEAEPAVRVRSDRPGLVGELNAQWHRLASEAGVVGPDGVFLLCAPGSDRWVRVRLAEGWDLAGVLGERPGQPEFVTLSLDGDVLLGVTTEEYDVWLVAVDRLRERQEEAARAAAAETPEDRAAAWAKLFEGPPPTERVLDGWASGLSLNPAAPVELRARLLERSPYAVYSRLPTEVVDAALAHPDWSMRMRTAEGQPELSTEQWSRFILGERQERTRWLATMLAADHWAALP